MYTNMKKHVFFTCLVGTIALVSPAFGQEAVADVPRPCCPGALTDLQPVAINPGESVLATFLEEKLYPPEMWTIHDGTAQGLTMQKDYRMFHGAMFQWLRRPANGVPGFCMERDFDVDLRGFDNLIVAAVIPDGARLTVTAATDKGLLERVFEKQPDNRREYLIPLDGATRLKHLTLAVSSDADGMQSGAVLWLMLQNEKKLADYLSSLVPYDKQWEGHLKGADYEPSFTPTYGIVFAPEELEEIRRRHQSIVEADGTSPYVEAAREMMAVDPEDIIKVSPGDNIRFARDRDLAHPNLKPSDLAVAGILLRDKDMLRMAARYAMTLAVTPYWDEGFMAHFPGSPWMHAAFKESWVAHELGITLDLAGEMFTDEGREFILKRLATDAIGHINYVTWRSEYIHRMNQMTVFSHGRILAYAILEKSMPRVKPYLDLAYQDLYNNLQIAIRPDGSDVEGPGYMTYTVAEAGLALHYYARARGKSLAEVTPPNLLRTADFAEAISSTDGDNDVISVCDATPQIERVDALSFLTAITPGSRWADMHRKAWARRLSGGRTLVDKQPLGILSLVVPAPENAASPAVKPFVYLPEMGIMASTRKVGTEWSKLFIQGNRAKAGHTHEDKGSFVLEFAGETFAGDFGTAMYGDAMTFAVKQCQWHNMLIPVVDTMDRPAPDNPVLTDVKPEGEGDATRFEATIDVTPAWGAYFSKNCRTWTSPTPDELTVTDEYELTKGKGVEFRWHTMLPVRREGRKVVIEGEKGCVEIQIPKGASCRIEPSKWWTGRQVNRIVFTKMGRKGTLETKVHLKLKEQ